MLKKSPDRVQTLPYSNPTQIFAIPIGIVPFVSEHISTIKPTFDVEDRNEFYC